VFGIETNIVEWAYYVAYVKGKKATMKKKRSLKDILMKINWDEKMSTLRNLAPYYRGKSNAFCLIMIYCPGLF